MSESKRTFYPTGPDAVTVNFASTDGMSEEFVVEAKGFTTDNPAWIARAETGCHTGTLTESKPKPEPKPEETPK